MGNRWSNVLKEPSAASAVEAYDMLDLEAERLARIAAEKAARPPHDCSQLQREAFEAGARQGREEVRQQAEAETRRALDLVAQAEQDRLHHARQAEIDIIELALAIAKKVILREVAIDHGIVQEQVRRTIALMDEKGLIRVRVNPEEFDALQAIRPTLHGSDGKPVRVHVECDASVQAGGCVLESSQYFIDARIETQLEEIWQGMLAADASPNPSEPA